MRITSRGDFWIFCIFLSLKIAVSFNEVIAIEITIIFLQYIIGFIFVVCQNYYLTARA